MDKKDKRIIYEMTKNSRIPLKQLAKKIQLSESSTKYRLDKLFKDGIITETYPVIDVYKLGFIGIRIYFKFLGTTPNEEKEMINWLVKQEKISVVGESTGNVDISLFLWTKNLYEHNIFINEFKSKYRKKITNFDFFIYLGTHYFPKNYLVDFSESNIIITDSSKQENIDNIDKKIIKLFLKDARQSITTIAKEINEPARTITYRLKQLEKKKIIAGYSANVNLMKIGYDYYKLSIITYNNMKQETLIKLASSLKNTVYIDETMGKYDFELNIEVQNRKELYKIIDKLKEITGGFQKLDLFQLKKFHKLYDVEL